MVTKRIKSSIRAEWAHESIGSIQPQPPPHSTTSASPKQEKGPRITKRKHEEMSSVGSQQDMAMLVLTRNGRVQSRTDFDGIGAIAYKFAIHDVIAEPLSGTL